MPAIILAALAGAAVGGIGGFAVGDGLSATSRLVQYGAIGVGVYVGARALKVI